MAQIDSGFDQPSEGIRKAWKRVYPFPLPLGIQLRHNKDWRQGDGTLGDTKSESSGKFKANKVLFKV